jgi:hypothetical protein
MERNRFILIVASIAWLIGAVLVLNKYVFGLRLPFGEGSELIFIGVTSLCVLTLSKKKA